MVTLSDPAAPISRATLGDWGVSYHARERRPTFIIRPAAAIGFDVTCSSHPARSIVIFKIEDGWPARAGASVNWGWAARLKRWSSAFRRRNGYRHGRAADVRRLKLELQPAAASARVIASRFLCGGPQNLHDSTGKIVDPGQLPRTIGVRKNSHALHVIIKLRPSESADDR